MNFSVYAYWTAGAKDCALMPNDGGLRVCRCGTVFLLRDAIRLEIEASPDTPLRPISVNELNIVDYCCVAIGFFRVESFD